jgi:hypothetical protein
LKDFIRTGLTNNFSLLVKDNIIKINKLQPKINEKRQYFKDLEANNEQPNNYEIILEKEELSKLEAKQWRYSIIAIVFSVITLESVIYDYSAIAFSDSYSKKYLDKLDLKSKWVVIPKLVTGEELSRDEQGFQYLNEIIQFRNNIIHHKTSNLDFSKEGIEKYINGDAGSIYSLEKSVEVAYKGFKAIDLLLKSLGEIDSNARHYNKFINEYDKEIDKL